MALIPSIINWLNTKRMVSIDMFKTYPYEVQLETFINLLNTASGTTWGEHYNYKNIDSISQYQETVPIGTYTELEPYIERLRQGEKDLLWPGEIRWFAKSSGTTSSKSKFIPVSREALDECHF